MIKAASVFLFILILVSGNTSAQEEELPGYVTRNIVAFDPGALFYRLKIPFDCELSRNEISAVINNELLARQIQPTIQLEDYLNIEAGDVFLYFEVSCMTIATSEDPEFGFAFKIDGKFGKVFADENGTKSDFLLDHSYGRAGSNYDRDVILEAVRQTAESMLRDFVLVNNFAG
ncbi:MAG: hypothetical protein CMP91_07580 [Gammaproteobacteria bacterium]|nr:hypothetical protein [Gammaproteobacteria bacterium]MAY03472.1 hypothetical protein [Gammaproteobacteria bacterium]|tara:strand:+ start:137362 stop:137883 length:522 start_codon:yes stop_codon:yes gene_type:complete